MDIGKNLNGLWLVMGDFNAYLHSDEKVGSDRHDWRSMSSFSTCLNQCELMDMGCKGPQFTWEKGKLKERIDRACFNLQWQLCFPESFVVNGLCFKSDHRPVVVDLGIKKPSSHGPRPFRFQATWLSHQYFGKVVEVYIGWMDGCKKFTKDVTRWNKEVYGNIFQRKQTIFHHLNGIERTLERYARPNLVTLRNDLWTELNCILKQEEMFWFQKSRCSWWEMGDRNTRFFHTSTIIRRKKNKILALKDSNGEWIYDQDVLVGMVRTFYLNLFSQDVQRSCNGVQNHGLW